MKSKTIIVEIKERELMTKKLSKYIDSFDYFDKFSIVLLPTSGSISIASFATVIGTSVGIASANLSLLKIIKKYKEYEKEVYKNCYVS